MIPSVIDYLLQLPEAMHFAKVHELCSDGISSYRMLSDYGSGTFQLIEFENNLLLILIGDYKPKDTFEKITEISVVALVVADDQTGVGMRFEAVEQPRERTRADLRAAACARGELRQLYFGFHGVPPWGGAAEKNGRRPQVCLYYSTSFRPGQKSLVFCRFIQYNDRSIYMTLHREV